MKIVGIIAEYNPFHNGHLYQINYAKEVLKADAVVVVMSGNFVQRGEPAIFDKYVRADMALKNGADLVIEMPTVGACASAEIFASFGIYTLIQLGIITDVIFGCEDESLPLFKGVGQLLIDEPKAFKDTLAAELRDGKPFAKARANALVSAWKNEEEKVVLSHFLSNPNNILGIEYTKAILQANSNINIVPLGRVGASHDDLKFSGTYASATYLRSTLLGEGASEYDVFSFVPTNCLDLITNAMKENTLISPDDCSILLHDALYKTNDYSEILDCTKELSNRILNERDNYISFSSFCDVLKTKNTNHSRIRRVLTHLYLNIKENALNAIKEENYAPYFHILGFTKRGSGLLSDIKKNSHSTPIFTSPNEVTLELNENQQILFDIDLNAANVYRMLLINKSKMSHPTEFTRKFVPHENVDFLNLFNDN